MENQSSETGVAELIQKMRRNSVNRTDPVSTA